MDNRLFLGHDKLEVLAHHFKVVDTHGAMLFAVNKNEVTIGANALHVEGEGGAVFRESIQTPFIRAEPGKELKCVSTAQCNSIQCKTRHCIHIIDHEFKFP